MRRGVSFISRAAKPQFFAAPSLRCTPPCFRNCATAAPEQPPKPATPVTNILDGIDYTGYLPQEEFNKTIEALQLKYGNGTADLHRIMYKELCDELRRERYSKPPSPEYYWGDWDFQHKPGSGKLTLKKKVGEMSIVIGADIKLADPKQLNETLSFVNWYEIDVLIRRDSVIMHYMVAAAEKQMMVRNIRAYEVDDKVDLMSFNADADFERFFQHYDGPYIYHVELDMQTELIDLMIDTGVTSFFVRYVAEWVAYLEHVEYVRWLKNMLDATIPGGVEDERLLLSFEERRGLDEEIEEWREIVRV